MGQNLLHCGHKPIKNNKYILRSDIMVDINNIVLENSN